MKIDIVAGFLGAGKTTLIKKIIDSKLKDEKLAIIENEFGEVSIDGDLLKDTNIDIKEINSGCICCSLAGDFKNSIQEIIKVYSPDRLIIEPSGVAKLSDIMKSCRDLGEEFEIDNIFTVVDATNFNMYLENFGEFYKDQIKETKVVVFSKVENIDKDALEKMEEKVKKLNKTCQIVDVPGDMLDGNTLLAVKNTEKNYKEISRVSTAKFNMKVAVKKHEHHHDHHADDVFNSWGIENTKDFTAFELNNIFENIGRDKSFGNILRGKGIVRLKGGKWVEFHYVPGRFQMNVTSTQEVGKIAIIGEKVNKEKLSSIFK